MSSSKNELAASRLKTLAKEIKKVEPQINQKVKEAIAPVETAISEIDETFRPGHYAQSLLDSKPGEANRSLACFARDLFSNGEEAEYLLCVARDPDSVCRVCASLCKFSVKPAPEAGKKAAPEVTIQQTQMLSLDELAIRTSPREAHTMSGKLLAVNIIELVTMPMPL